MYGILKQKLIKMLDTIFFKGNKFEFQVLNYYMTVPLIIKYVLRNDFIISSYAL